MVGVRSSVYLPFQNLGLVVIDEEHDSSYRQFDPAPRLQARDTAIMLSSSFGAHTLLGSATPSVESMYNVKQQKYGFAYLGERYANYMPPLIEIIDLKDKQHRKQMTGHFSDALIKSYTANPERRATSVALSEQTRLCAYSAVYSLWHRTPMSSLRCKFNLSPRQSTVALPLLWL